MKQYIKNVHVLWNFKCNRNIERIISLLQYWYDYIIINIIVWLLITFTSIFQLLTSFSTKASDFSFWSNLSKVINIICHSWIFVMHFWKRYLAMLLHYHCQLTKLIIFNVSYIELIFIHISPIVFPCLLLLNCYWIKSMAWVP